MDFQVFVIDLYKKGHSIQYITIHLFNIRNKVYFDNYKSKRLTKEDKYIYIEECRKFVEDTIIEYNSHPLKEVF